MLIIRRRVFWPQPLARLVELGDVPALTQEADDTSPAVRAWDEPPPSLAFLDQEPLPQPPAYFLLQEDGGPQPKPWPDTPLVSLAFDDGEVLSHAVIEEGAQQSLLAWGAEHPASLAGDEDALPQLRLEEDSPLRLLPWQPWIETPLGSTIPDEGDVLPLAPVLPALDEEAGLSPGTWPGTTGSPLAFDDGEMPTFAPSALDEPGSQGAPVWAEWERPPRPASEDASPPRALDEGQVVRQPAWAVDWAPAWVLPDDGLIPPVVVGLEDEHWPLPARWESGWPRETLLADEALVAGAYFALDLDPFTPSRQWSWSRHQEAPRPFIGLPDERVPFIFTALEPDAWLSGQPWALTYRIPWFVPDEWCPQPVNGFTGGFSTATLTAIAGGSLIEIIGLAPEGYRVRGLATTIVDSFGTSGGLTALLLGDPVLEDRWGRQDDLTEGAITNQHAAHSDSEPIAGVGGYALQIAVEGGLMDSTGRIRVRLFWERLQADVV